MNVEELKLSQDKAEELFKKYEQHREGFTDADREIAAIYKHIAQGRTVIRALESIRAAGVNEQGLPKLAICPANMTECWFQYSGIQENRQVVFGKRDARHRERKTVVRMPWPGFAEPKVGNRWWHCAQVPLIPVHLRPKHALSNYHILWEAEWAKRYPVDPYLLRRFGGDAWLVLAAWDLTDVERAVMSQRLSS